MVENKYNCDTVVTTGLSRRTVKFCDFLSNFRKNTAKNTRKFSRLLHFFDIFVTVRPNSEAVLLDGAYSALLVRTPNCYDLLEKA